MRKHLFFSVMLSMCTFGGMAVYPTPAMATVAQSPTIKVRGQVIDEQGEPMPGATIKIKGGQGGTVTDLDGNFQLEVPGNATLLISYVGFKEREVAVRNRAIIEDIQLQADNKMLEQSPPCSKVRFPVYRSPLTDNPEPILPFASVASGLSETPLLFTLSTAFPWELPSAISLQTILKPSKC